MKVEISNYKRVSQWTSDGANNISNSNVQNHYKADMTKTMQPNGKVRKIRTTYTLEGTTR